MMVHQNDSLFLFDNEILIEIILTYLSNENKVLATIFQRAKGISNESKKSC